MKRFKSVLLCMAVSTATFTFVADDEDSKLPDFTPGSPIHFVNALQPPQELDVGQYGKLPEDTALPPTAKLTVEDQAQLLSRQTKAGGKAGFAAFIQALRLSGIAVVGADGTLSPASGRKQGLSLSITSLQAMAGDVAVTTPVPLLDFMAGAAGYLTHTEVQAFGEAFLGDLQKMAASRNVALQFFMAYVDALGAGPGNVSLLRGVGADRDLAKIGVSPLQMSLLGTRLGAEVSAHFQKKPGFPEKLWRTELGRFATQLITSPSADCLQQAGETVDDVAQVKGEETFQDTIKITARDSSDNPERVMKNAENLSNFLRLNAVAMKAFDFRVFGGAREGLPLIRTKTTSKGERKTLFLEFKPVQTQNEFSKCLSEFTSALGLKLKKNAKDPDFFQNIDVTMQLQKVAGRDRLVFNSAGGSNETKTRQKVSDKGLVEVPVYGAPQEQNLAASFKPNMLSVPIHVEYTAPLAQFYESVPGEEVSEAAGRGLIRLDRANQGKRRKYTEIEVQDWIGKAEGTVATHVESHYHKTKTHVTAYSFQSTKVDYDLTLDTVQTVLPSSTLIPPMNFPNVPPQYRFPQLSVDYVNSESGSSEFSYDHRDNSDCTDPCDPREKGERRSAKSVVENFTFNADQPRSSAVFAGPIWIDTSAKVLKIKMMIPVLNKAGTAQLDMKANVCDGTPDPASTKNALVPIKQATELFRFLDLEVPYVEDHGLAVAKMSFDKDFGYRKTVSISNENVSRTVPASMVIKVDLKIPLF